MPFLRRKIVLGILPLLGLSMSLSFVTPLQASTPAPSASQPLLERLAGDDRYQTALAIANKLNPGSVNSVILASGLDFPDALAGSVLAHQKNAPILLANPNETESSETISYIQKHLDTNGTIYLLGGTGVIPDSFKETFNGLGYENVVRLGGADRYDTASKIAEELATAKGTPVAIAFGKNFPDALSISSFAGNKGWPILLAQTETLPDSVKTFLSAQQPSEVYIAGGTGVISDQVKAQIQALVPNAQIERLAGQDRYQTSSLIDSYFAPNPTHIYLASGQNFPDALAGSALASQMGYPIVLVDPDSTQMPAPISNYLQLKYGKTSFRVTALGGTGVVPDPLVDQAVNGIRMTGQFIPNKIVQKGFTIESLPAESTLKFSGTVSASTKEVLLSIQKDGREELVPAQPVNGLVQKDIYPRFGPGQYTITIIEDNGITEQRGESATLTYTGNDGFFDTTTADSTLDIDAPTYTETTWVWFLINGPHGLTENYYDKTMGRISSRVYFRDGPGKYTVQVFESRDPDGLNYTTGPWFTVTNTDTRDLIYLSPSDQVQSDDPNIIKLAQEITAGLSTDWEKSQAIHDWVAPNIAFDTAKILAPTNANYSALDALSNKKATSKGYATLTAALHRAVGIPAKVVIGYTRGLGVPVQPWDQLTAGGEPGDEWNAVLLNGQWITEDTMWDAGTIDSNGVFQPRLSEKYFNPSPEDFANDHLAVDDTHSGVKP